ncbi:MAG: hypothetical protein OXG15_16085 [Gammaproteobacteria bacterium]|nr:hypothetical protein [Gammaproteobacteria bacterium]
MELSWSPQKGSIAMQAILAKRGRTRLVQLFSVLVVAALVSLGAIAEEVEQQTPSEEVDKEVPVTLASILDSKPNPKDYQKRTHCISKIAIRDHEVLSKRHIVFTMRGEGRPKVLVQFGRHCFGLHRKALINLESRGSSRLCVGDYVRTEVFEFGRRTWGPRCTIPDFEPITDYQLELLRDALQTGRVE